MTDLEYIKKFSKITIKNICEKNNIKPNNLWSGKVSQRKIHKIKIAIDAELANLAIEEYLEYDCY